MTSLAPITSQMILQSLCSFSLSASLWWIFDKKAVVASKFSSLNSFHYVLPGTGHCSCLNLVKVTYFFCPTSSCCGNQWWSHSALIMSMQCFISLLWSVLQSSWILPLSLLATQHLLQECTYFRAQYVIFSVWQDMNFYFWAMLSECTESCGFGIVSWTKQNFPWNWM